MSADVVRWIGAAIVAAAVSAGATADRPIDVLERAVAENPEDLKIAADYRQLAIAARDFDRSIDFLEKLAKRSGSGPNIQISLALAYVDKVPTSGDMRRLYLGRDAMNALSKSIAQRPTVAAYYVRGLVNLYYNKFIFKRTDKGVADLEHALSIAPPDTPPKLLALIYLALGEGYFRLEQLAKARETWARGLALFPGDPRFSARLEAQGKALADIVTDHLYTGNRVDTTLDGLLPIR